MKRAFCGTFRNRIFLSMLLLTVIPLILCSVLLIVIFRTRMTESASGGGAAP